MSSKAQIPQGWRQVRLGDVAEVDTGGTPNRSRPEYWDGQIPWMASGQINQRRVMTTVERITWEGLKNSNAKLFPSGTVMVAMNGQGATRGKACVLGIEASCNQSLAAICSRQQTKNGFLFHVLDSAYHLLRSLTGDGRAGLNLELIRGFSFLLPPLREQRAIAAVLDTIDDAIEGTKAVIAATEQLRESLLHQLLTRGVPGWHTEWKEAPGLGMIPAGWEVVRLGDVVPKFEYGTSVRCTIEPVGMPILRIPNIASGDLNLSDLKYAELSAKESAILQIDAGDILLVRTNGNPDICGQCWVSDGLEGQWGFASYLVRGRADRFVINPWFVGHFLRSVVGRRLLKANIRTSAGNYNLSVGSLGSMSLPFPPINEQDSIVNTIRSLSRSIELAGEEEAGLRLLKESTADALLTGRVRMGQ